MALDSTMAAGLNGVIFKYSFPYKDDLQCIIRVNSRKQVIYILLELISIIDC